MTHHEVVIVGGGPTGLMLAAELALAKIDVAIVERRPTQGLMGARAGGLQSRTIEVFDQRGIADRFLAEGQRAQVTGFAWNRLDLSDFPTRHPYGLALWQSHIERIMGAWVAELGVPISRGCEVIGFSQHETGVNVEVSDGPPIQAQYLVGCDGGRSLVRTAAGIDFAGEAATTSWLIAEVELTFEPPWGIRRDAKGINSISRMENGGPVRVLVSEAQLGPNTQPTLRDFSEAMIAVYGSDFGAHAPTWLSRFTDAARQAVRYRNGRVLLAGDAAHVHHPVGGQGLNIGVQDAVNLGWKLAQVVRQISPERLLDTYEAERHPIGARLMRNQLAQTALLRPLDERLKAVNETITDLLTMSEPRKRYAAMMSGLDVHYDCGEGHPLLGRRMPDLDLVVDGQTRRVFSFLHQARPLLINFGPAPISDPRVQSIEATTNDVWELPAMGLITPPATVLVRPDGHVAWVGDGTQQGLAEALITWVGAQK